MRLLDTTNCQFVEADPRNVDYAILSHTWDRGGEQTFQELRRIQEGYASKIDGSIVSGRSTADGDYSPTQLEVIARVHTIWKNPNLSAKIRDACATARKEGFRLIWIDSCCIDKTSSSELSEAINSMYAWYAGAQVCYAYLVDVAVQDDHRAESSRFRESVWFTRGWTLQELLAPFEVTILSQDWRVIGSKRGLVDVIEQITGISSEALLHETPLGEFSVAQRLSWASHRRTTRAEDRAYSLLGIFDINIPTLYGEGERAFRRLQEAIMQRIPDQSLLAWGSIYEDSPSEEDWRHLEFACLENQLDRSILAPSPIGFAEAGSVSAVSHKVVCDFLRQSDLPVPEYTSTPHGIRTQLPMMPLSLFLPPNVTYPPGSGEWYLAILGCESTTRPGNLLGSVYHVPLSDSGVDVLCCGMAHISPAPELGGDWPNLFPLPPATIEKCHELIKPMVVYITHPDHALADWALQAALQRPPRGTIHLILTQKTRRALRARGYAAKLRGPDGDHPTTHWLRLAGDDHVVAIEYRHSLKQEELLIDGHVTVSRPGVPPSLPDEVFGKRVVWSDGPPWTSLLSQQVNVLVSEVRARTVKLGLNFVWQSYFAMEVDILDYDHMYTGTAPAGGAQDVI
ncbi:hypothetical protein GSI_07867 [Ganoderma sinense ZZ0214-1]|uniref:Uncharacterized protein n=1 Tax=Ganoderma sinense ZZ0214-1 TaxID=1077348 RepID=A0A2G8S852_9APHY|nr:hypothetical protein GSI_07867 [Ganoderma sinense ZZ0214-1]